MNSTRLITVKIDKPLKQLMEYVLKDYQINLSSLIRRLLQEEFSNTQKYRRTENV